MKPGADKIAARQDHLPKVKWGEQEVDNSWVFIYLGSLFQADGDHTPDVQRRINKAKSRAGRLRHILQSPDLELDLRLRLYIAGCCSVLCYGSEAWYLDDKRQKMINGTNAQMLSHITGKTRQEEASRDITSFNVLLWIRSRRIQ